VPLPSTRGVGSTKKGLGCLFFSPRTNHAGACPYRVPHAGLQARVPPPYVELDVHGRGARGGGSGGLGIGVLPAVDRGTGAGGVATSLPMFFCFVGLGGVGVQCPLCLRFPQTPNGHHPLRASPIILLPSLSCASARVALSSFGVDCCVPGWASTGRVAQVSPPNIAGGRALTFFMCGGWGLLGGELLASMEAAGC
jgi:hypothetical protein